eukprot:TRINITY_DN8990_c0_g1_i1.p1 TRINITY_DN8990_c0_g1~~TRINITY_DN8990_c0_g1_i1.p1  ORF type:complete len:581 (-),score=105.78 TRINITY_DN8990_c0_g1_i1:281-1981(-)
MYDTADNGNRRCFTSSVSRGSGDAAIQGEHLEEDSDQTIAPSPAVSQQSFQQLSAALLREHARIISLAQAKIDALSTENGMLRAHFAALGIPPPDAIRAQDVGSKQAMDSEETPAHVHEARSDPGMQCHADEESSSNKKIKSDGIVATEHHWDEAEVLAAAANVPMTCRKSQLSQVIHGGVNLKQTVKTFLRSPKFDAIISGILLINVLVMAVEMQVTGLRLKGEGPSDEDWHGIAKFFKVLDAMFTIVFAAEVVARMSFLGLVFWKSTMNYIDLIVSVVTVVDLASSLDDLPISPLFFRLIRLGKVARAFRMLALSARLESFGLLVKCLLSSLDVLSWASLLLIIIQGLAAIVFSLLVQDYLRDTDPSTQVWRDVYSHYGTYTRSFFTMFEIMFANWAPGCRMLMDNISEAFGLLFIVYRCMIGLSLINVVNSIFVSQTLKFASTDEEFMAKKLAKENETYRRKLEQLFMGADDSGDGYLTKQEFVELLSDDHMKLWLTQLGLEYHDLVALFDLIDDGDGRINWEEFLNGSKMLRGGAKSIDVFRLETKVDKLLQQDSSCDACKT